MVVHVSSLRTSDHTPHPAADLTPSNEQVEELLLRRGAHQRTAPQDRTDRTEAA
ncbi:hypothetical protein [Nocardia callitridis]|uniref:hypothetical protein n=1 Tax=Nocardia callitridis TaxID=648753 RepID=UPI0031EC2F03